VSLRPPYLKVVGIIEIYTGREKLPNGLLLLLLKELVNRVGIIICAQQDSNAVGGQKNADLPLRYPGAMCEPKIDHLISNKVSVILQIHSCQCVNFFLLSYSRL